ncbi:MAG: LytTR family DNA-binding domain-containing protein [Flavitalea sp.]
MSQQQKNFTAIIADDNKLDRLLLESYVKRYSFISIIGVYPTATEALEVIRKNGIPDILFVDIDMPGMSGLELRDLLPEIPACIFVTSHPEFALESFELAALDYLVKPLNGERFSKTMERLELFLNLHHKAGLLDYTLGGDVLFIKDGVNQVKLNLHDIIYLEALKDYTSIVTTNKKYCVSSPLGNLLKENDFRGFLRIHRSYAIQKHFVKQVSSKGIKINEHLLPVGRTYREAVDKILQS